MSPRLQAFQDFIATQSIQIPIWGFILNLLLAAILGHLLMHVYIRFGEGLSNRHQFSRNFILLAMTTTLIISIIKSSLALSLGLVGALSIVRFRAAIKEPEELTYLFLTIAIGLGLGAGQRLMTIVAVALIIGAIYLKYLRYRNERHQNLSLTIMTPSISKISIDKISAILKECCKCVYLKRFDESSEHLEAAFLVEYSNIDELKTTRDKLKAIDEKIQVSYLDNQGLI